MAEKEKKFNNPFVSQGKKFEAEGNWDQDYISISIVDRVVKTGENDDDFVIKKVVIKDKQPISEVVQVDAESVGVYNIIKQVMRTGDTSLLPVDTGNGEIVDTVGAPENLMELKQMGVNAEKAFKGLPDELKGELDMVSFINSMDQEKFDAFIKAIADRQAGSVQKEVKENE